MTRSILTVLFLLVLGTVHAQLSLGGDAGARSLPDLRADLVPEVLPVTNPVGLRPELEPGTRGRAPFTASSDLPQRPAFDFRSAKPYLAFFCRLELDIEEATRFPVRFRLGEVRTWQQELSKRD